VLSAKKADMSFFCLTEHSINSIPQLSIWQHTATQRHKETFIRDDPGEPAPELFIGDDPGEPAPELFICDDPGEPAPETATNLYRRRPG